ncbi:hypothetical protein V493_00342 [Pseudogymnoascus sp. VKM F-4281 (FW-2241)]|nr:hypothetical protein V493_00342 [Pseudogymnoascus sp. VKM F-4281 (FW-2241)]
MGNTGSIPDDARRRNGIIDAMSEYHRDKAARYQEQVQPGARFGIWENMRDVVLALQAMKTNPKLSARAAGELYKVDFEKLCRRNRGIPARRDIPANSRKLSNIEEQVLIRYILSLAAKGFPPRLSVVEDMANRLLATRDAPRVGSRWASNFCEDPEVIHGWFELVQNTIVKYGINDADIYNFNKTGFMMGVISTAIVVTSSDGWAKAKTVQPSNREWVTVILSTAIVVISLDGSRLGTAQPWVSQTPNNPIEAMS